MLIRSIFGTCCFWKTFWSSHWGLSNKIRGLQRTNTNREKVKTDLSVFKWRSASWRGTGLSRHSFETHLLMSCGAPFPTHTQLRTLQQQFWTWKNQTPRCLAVFACPQPFSRSMHCWCFSYLSQDHWYWSRAQTSGRKQENRWNTQAWGGCPTGG